MTTSKKESIGFKTPSKLLEEQYAVIFEMLESRGTSWSKLKTGIDQVTAVIQPMLQEAIKNNNTEAVVNIMNMLLRFYSLGMSCELGEQLNDIAKRLARMEKKLAPKIE